MNRVELSKNLYLDEYIPKSLYQQYQHKPHLLIGLIDKVLIEADQKLRDYFGPVTINNWVHGGDRQWSGLRTRESDYYSYLSQHTFGRASDKIFRDVTADEVRNHLKKHYKKYGITCIEADVSWVHSDVRQCAGDNLIIVYP